jgi:D-glycero-D-manno-heptose 1,7-bisphosphate phosphatase
MRALLLDRDGVICENRADYVRRPEQFRFLPGALGALVALSRAGYKLIVVTNQSMVGRGIVPRAGLEAVHRLMRDEVERAGGAITDVLACEHAPGAGCPCRKPQAGLILEALRRHDLGADLYMVGDHTDDVTAALRAAVRPIHVETGRGRASRVRVRWLYGDRVTYLPGLPDVASLLLGDQSGVAATAPAADARL